MVKDAYNKPSANRKPLWLLVAILALTLGLCGSGLYFLPTILKAILVPTGQVVACVSNASAPITSTANYNLTSVYMTSPNDGWAVGDGDYADYNFLHYNGTSWSRMDNSQGPSADKVFMLSANEGWAVGRENFFHYKDRCWHDEGKLGFFPSDLNYVPLTGIYMTSANDGWAVGDGLIAHYDGNGWSKVTAYPDARDQSVDDVFMLSANEGWAVGYGTTLHYKDGSWQKVPSPGGVVSVYMVSPGEGWAVGKVNTILHFVGGTWSVVNVPTDGYLKSIYMTSASEGWAVGDSILHYKDGKWIEVGKPTKQTLTSVYMLSANEGWAVGYEVILHYKDGVWSEYK